MLWKVIAFFLFSIFLFVIGLWLGSLQSEWAKPENRDAVAYLAMIGGWVSGIATSIAVIISLYVTYQTSQINIENVYLSFEKALVLHNRDIKFKIVVKNNKPLVVYCNRILIAISGSKKAVNISKTYYNKGALPYTLNHLGEEYQFIFDTRYNHLWSGIFSNLENSGKPKFNKGYIIVETAMKQYRLKMPKEFLLELRKTYAEHQVRRSR